MKQIIFLLFLFIWYLPGQAQLQNSKEAALTRDQKWLLQKTELLYQDKKTDKSLQVFLQQYKTILASNRHCLSQPATIATLQLEGERLNTETTLLKWDVTNDMESGDYIIERRLDHPYGAFDSVGRIAYSFDKAVLKSFHFMDRNDYPGKTWYRLRKTGGAHEVKKMVSVDGYNNKVNVFPNPAPTSQVQVQLLHFRPDDDTRLQVLDANSRIVYTQRKVLLNGSNVFRLPYLHLQPGTYFIKVMNKLNTGASSFVIR